MELRSHCGSCQAVLVTLLGFLLAIAAFSSTAYAQGSSADNGSVTGSSNSRSGVVAKFTVSANASASSSGASTTTTTSELPATTTTSGASSTTTTSELPTTTSSSGASTTTTTSELPTTTSSSYASSTTTTSELPTTTSSSGASTTTTTSELPTTTSTSELPATTTTSEAPTITTTQAPSGDLGDDDGIQLSPILLILFVVALIAFAAKACPRACPFGRGGGGGGRRTWHGAHPSTAIADDGVAMVEVHDHYSDVFDSPKKPGVQMNAVGAVAVATDARSPMMDERETRPYAVPKTRSRITHSSDSADTLSTETHAKGNVLRSMMRAGETREGNSRKQQHHHHQSSSRTKDEWDWSDNDQVNHM